MSVQGLGCCGASGPVSEVPGPGAGVSASRTGGVTGRTGIPVFLPAVRRAGPAAGTTPSVTWCPGPGCGPPAPA